MARLLLVNLDGDPDGLYKGFEPQAFDDDVHGTGLIVLGWRHDGRIDVFHQPGMRLDPATYSIAGDGLHLMLERPLEGARFEIGPAGVDADIRFEDAAGRTVEIRIVERSPRPPSRFGLLAPMGEAASAPSALPLVLLREFAFVRRARTEARVAIDGRDHRLDLLPVPIDRARMYFVRYAEAPLIATLNPAHDGALAPLDHEGGRLLVDAGDDLTLARAPHHVAIAGVERTHDGQAVRVTFEPPFPNPLDLRPGADLSGRFEITSDPRLGSVAGTYAVRRDGDAVHVRLVPSDGWRPNETKWSLWLVYRVASVFRTWPSTYVWEAEIDVAPSAHATLRSAWRRVR